MWPETVAYGRGFSTKEVAVRRVRFLAIIGVAALLLGACGNDTSNSGEGGSTKGDLDNEEQEYVDAMTASLLDSSGEEDAIPEDQAECWAAGMVDGVGVDKLKEAGITPEVMAGDSDDDVDFEDLSEADRKVVAESFTECIDLEDVFLQSLTTDGDEPSKETKECLAAIDWTVIEKEFVDMIISGEDMDENSAAMAPLLGCMLSEMGDMDMDDLETGVDEGDTTTTVG